MTMSPILETIQIPPMPPVPTTGATTPGVSTPRAAVRIAERFEGPPGIVNGGYVSGLLAERLGGQADVTLRRPTPTGEAVAIKVRAGSAWIEQAGEVLVAAQKATLELDVPCRPDFRAAQRARELFDAARHPFRECFVCGPDRHPGDGLCILAGPVSEGVVAAPWVPDASLSVDGTEGSPVLGRFVWSALDCPGAMAAVGGALARPMLLGQIHGAHDSAVHAGEPCVVVGWKLASHGRKHEVATALLDSQGRVAARSSQTWIEPRR